jgi:hypothetical protein
MSQENVEIVARLVDAWNQANLEAMLALFDPEWRWASRGRLLTETR